MDPALGDSSPEPELHPTDRQLVRAIGTRALAASAVNLTVGGGIFVLPGVVAAQLGPAALAAYAVCGIAMLLVMLCYAEAGSRVASSGGASAYVEAAFGPYAGFLVATLYWFGYAAASDAAISAPGMRAASGPENAKKMVSEAAPRTPAVGSSIGGAPVRSAISPKSTNATRGTSFTSVSSSTARAP
jgi:hypothetical protein